MRYSDKGRRSAASSTATASDPPRSLARHSLIAPTAAAAPPRVAAVKKSRRVGHGTFLCDERPDHDLVLVDEFEPVAAAREGSEVRPLGLQAGEIGQVEAGETSALADGDALVQELHRLSSADD